MKWITTKSDLSNTKVSRHICVGKCSVNTRSHFASGQGFVKQAWAVDKNNNLWLKGKCAGWELIRSESKKEQTELDEPQLIGISEWTDLSSDEEVTREAQWERFRKFHAKRMAEIERMRSLRARTRQLKPRKWNPRHSRL